MPTGLEVHGRTIYLAEAGPIPHRPEDGRVLRVSPSSSSEEVAGGAPLLVDVERGRGRQVYALSQGVWDLPPTPPRTRASPPRRTPGSLLLADRHGGCFPWSSVLDRPTSFEIDGDTAFVSTLTGKVLEDRRPPMRLAGMKTLSSRAVRSPRQLPPATRPRVDSSPWAGPSSVGALIDTASVLVDESGATVASARAVWVELGKHDRDGRDADERGVPAEGMNEGPSLPRSERESCRLVASSSTSAGTSTLKRVDARSAFTWCAQIARLGALDR